MIERKKPKRRTCACGRPTKYNPYSSVQPAQCPSCQLKNLVSGDSQAIDKALSRRGATSKPKKRKKSEKELARDNADMWFSRYIRIKYSYRIQDGEVFCQCIVSPSVIKLAKHMDNGHMASRKYLKTRYYENNCRPQNRSSNRFSGEADHYIFEDNLKLQIGQDGIDEIHRIRKEEGEDTVAFYKTQSNKYNKLVNQLIKEHGIKKWW